MSLNVTYFANDYNCCLRHLKTLHLFAVHLAIYKHPNSCLSSSPVYLVRDIFIQTVLDSRSGTANLHVYDLPLQMDLSPLALELINHTRQNLAVELFETEKSDRMRSVRDHVRHAVCEAIPSLASGPVFWIPPHILNSLFTWVTSTETGRSTSVPYSLFLSATQLRQIELCIYQRLGDSGTATHPIRTRLCDLCDQGKMNEIHQLKNSKSPETSIFAYTSTGNSGSGLRIHLTNCTDLSFLGGINHPKPYYFMCTLELGQLAVSFLKNTSPSSSKIHLNSRHKPHQMWISQHRTEFLRLTVRRFDFHALLHTTNSDNQTDHPEVNMDMDISMRHIQLDNWAQAWTACYDFPVPFATTGLTKLRVRFASHSLTALFQSPTLAVFFFPGPFVLTLEDCFLYDLYDLLQSLQDVWQDFGAENGRGACTQPVLIRCIHVHRVAARVSLRAMFRFYLSCHEAPLSLASFDLCPNQSTSAGLAAITVTELRRLIVMHYFTQAIFRAGWLVGSLDMLGNVTGLLQSLAHGIGDLIHLRTSQFTHPNGEDKNATSEANRAQFLAMSLQVYEGTQQQYVTLGTTDHFDHRRSTDTMMYATRANFLKRLGDGLNSLARHTTA